jgi:hypothetical protein
MNVYWNEKKKKSLAPKLIQIKKSENQDS